MSKDAFEELAEVLNSAGVELSNLNSANTELIKKLFNWSELMQDSSQSDESSIRPYRNLLAVLYKEKIATQNQTQVSGGTL